MRAIMIDPKTYIDAKVDDLEEGMNIQFEAVKSEIHSLEGQIQGLKTGLEGQIHGLKTGLEGQIQGLRDQYHGLEGQIQGLRDQIGVVLLRTGRIEEQYTEIIDYLRTITERTVDKKIGFFKE
ncbi:MAG TPA: hypothetical protein VJB89_01760 [Candidatus Nanoarchaeia archaeon]|nr:hypothetical protein [Candidatus Nanoarchaeia archaeon]